MCVCEGRGKEFSLMLRVSVGMKDRLLTLSFTMCGKRIALIKTLYVYVWEGKMCRKGRPSACTH